MVIETLCQSVFVVILAYSSPFFAFIETHSSYLRTKQPEIGGVFVNISDFFLFLFAFCIHLRKIGSWTRCVVNYLFESVCVCFRWLTLQSLYTSRMVSISLFLFGGGKRVEEIFSGARERPVKDFFLVTTSALYRN